MKVTHGNSSCSIRKQEQASRVCGCFSQGRSEDDQNGRTQVNCKYIWDSEKQLYTANRPFPNSFGSVSNRNLALMSGL